jgi:hypothetical protein
MAVVPKRDFFSKIRKDANSLNWKPVPLTGFLPDLRLLENRFRGILSLPSPPDVVCGGFAGAGRTEGLEFYRTCISSLLLTPESSSKPTPHRLHRSNWPDSRRSASGGHGLHCDCPKGGRYVPEDGWMGPTFGDEGSGFWIGRKPFASPARSRHGQQAVSSRRAEGLGLSRITMRPQPGKTGASTCDLLLPSRRE